MNKQTRRSFIGNLAAAGGALAIRPLDGRASETPAPGEAEMSIARWGETLTTASDFPGVATRLTEAAIASLGGMERFVKKNDVVWIKPNIGWNRGPELAANTNPQVVATLTRLCLEAGAKKVKVGDNSCHSPRQTYRRSGIEKAVKEAGGEMVKLNEKRFKEAPLGGKRLKTWPVYGEILDADLLLNVPVLKHHGLSTASMAMKNLMGAVGGQRNAWHQAMEECLCDISAFLKPGLTVLDAVRALTAHGPQGGNPADVIFPGLVAAGSDMIALDALGAELLGHPIGSLDTVRAGHEAGLGNMHYRELALREETLT